MSFSGAGKGRYDDFIDKQREKYKNEFLYNKETVDKFRERISRDTITIDSLKRQLASLDREINTPLHHFIQDYKRHFPDETKEKYDKFYNDLIKIRAENVIKRDLILHEISKRENKKVEYRGGDFSRERETNNGNLRMVGRGADDEFDNLIPFSDIDTSNVISQMSFAKLKETFNNLDGLRNQWKSYLSKYGNGYGKEHICEIEIEAYKDYMTLLVNEMKSRKKVGGDKPPPNEFDKNKRVEQITERERRIIAHLAELERRRLIEEQRREGRERGEMFNEDTRQQEHIRRQRRRMLTHDLHFLHDELVVFQGTNIPTRDYMEYLLNFWNALLDLYPELNDVEYQRSIGVEALVERIHNDLEFWNDQHLHGDRELPRQ